jgi:uncharacterized OB-fold protein
MRPDFPLPDVTWEPAAPFWAAAAEGRLVIPRCDRCARLCWYPRPMCPGCEGSAFTWADMAGRGQLFSWVVVRHPFLKQFGEKVPFVTGLVSLEEDPSVRMATEVVDGDPDQLEFDQPMEVTFRPLRFGGIDGAVVAPLWRPR